MQHKADIPLSGQWKLLSPQEKCWICDNHNYTLFCWNLRSGEDARDAQYTSDGREEAVTIEKLEAINADCKKNAEILAKMGGRPHVMCA